LTPGSNETKRGLSEPEIMQHRLRFCRNHAIESRKDV
jgi:hypothetical protein